MSREYEALFNEMEKTPAIPAGISATWKCPSCGGINPNTVTTCDCRKGIHMPSLAATMPQVINHVEEVCKLFHGAYCAMEVNNPFRCLIIVPARNEAEAAVGSGILAIGRSQDHAWRMAYEAL